MYYEIAQNHTFNWNIIMYIYIYIIIKYLPKIEKTNHLKSSLKYIKMVVNYFDIFCMFP